MSDPLRYDTFPKCSGCGSITKRRRRTPHRAVAHLVKQLCPLIEAGGECDVPSECHAQIGIGVCTLGTKCGYPEGHDGDHDYGFRKCNKHKEGCP